MRPTVFFRELIYPMRYRGNELAWHFIGEHAYLRTKRHGVFKLTPGGETHGHIDRLEGEYTSPEGEKDRIWFIFEQLMAPDPSKMKNPDLVKDHAIHAWHTGYKPKQEVEWYVPPQSLQPLHDAICEWIRVWSGEPR